MLPFTGAKPEELPGATLEVDNHGSLGTMRLMGGSCAPLSA